MDVCSLRCFVDPLLRNIFQIVDNVLGDAQIEETGFLIDKAEARTQPLKIQLSNIHTIETLRSMNGRRMIPLDERKRNAHLQFDHLWRHKIVPIIESLLIYHIQRHLHVDIRSLFINTIEKKGMLHTDESNTLAWIKEEEKSELISLEYSFPCQTDLLSQWFEGHWQWPTMANMGDTRTEHDRIQ